jgi:hypothetical protein
MMRLHNCPWIIQGLVLGMIPRTRAPPFTRKSKNTREKLFMMKAETVIPL